ncbi:CopG family antitoxin [Salinarimonas rosea]|uniref:CopG family antitoxin n=1 Tax=Salinarimonas rosea TaxID=552063 RepID=UPI0003F8CA46|nr:CopG family antitoxin [Salinarimonas rosea]
MSEQRKPWPSLPSDEAAERFVAEADLSEYDWTLMEPVAHEFGSSEASVELRLPRRELDQLKAEAAKRGLPYERFMRELISRAMKTLEPL